MNGDPNMHQGEQEKYKSQIERECIEMQTAIELRRLHEEVTEQARLLGISAERELSLLAKIDRLEKQLGEAVWTYGEKVRVNQELLEALKELVEVSAHLDACQATVEQARAAIAKAGETK